MDDLNPKDENPRFLMVLEALKQASHELQWKPTSPDSNESLSSAIEALLDLETSEDPSLSTLSQHLTDLKTVVETLQKARGHTLRSFLIRRVSAHSISRVAGSIEFEIQAWIDRENVETLTKALGDQSENRGSEDEDELLMRLTQFVSRVNQGFNRELQELVLKSKLFHSFESILFDSTQSIRLRETAASCVAALIRFNKDVFVGKVSMDSTIHALIQMPTTCSTKVLCDLITLIKSAFVDEIVSKNKIPEIINLLNIKEIETRIVALDCILEIGYFGRKEAIEAMLEAGLIQKLVEMQRSELGGDLIEIAVMSSSENGKRVTTSEFLEGHPWASCVARFAVQLEVGEGLRQREKRELKQEILRRVREASVSDAEVSTIVAEVLWGSSP